MPRLNFASIDKKAYGIIGELLGHIAAGGLDEKLLHLIYLRVSQINGCGYCIDMHYKDAVKAGVDTRTINGVVGWRYMPFFSEAERAAFAWAEAVTRLENQQVPEAVFAALKAHYSDEQMVILTHAITEMNALNRLAIAFEKHADA